MRPLLVDVAEDVRKDDLERPRPRHAPRRHQREVERPRARRLGRVLRGRNQLRRSRGHAGEAERERHADRSEGAREPLPAGVPRAIERVGPDEEPRLHERGRLPRQGLHAQKERRDRRVPQVRLQHRAPREEKDQRTPGEDEQQGQKVDHRDDQPAPREDHASEHPALPTRPERAEEGVHADAGQHEVDEDVKPVSEVEIRQQNEQLERIEDLVLRVGRHRLSREVGTIPVRELPPENHLADDLLGRVVVAREIADEEPVPEREDVGEEQADHADDERRGAEVVPARRSEVHGRRDSIGGLGPIGQMGQRGRAMGLFAVRGCHPERSEGSQNARTAILAF